MAKKILFIFILYFLIQLGIVACFPKPETYYSIIHDIKITNTDLKQELSDSTTVSEENYRIKCSMSTESITQAVLSSNLIRRTYATSFEDNYVGLKSDIVRFEIRCDKDILGVLSGEPIPYEKFNVYKTWFTKDSLNYRETVDKWLDILNNGGYLLAFEWYFEFREKLNTDDYLKFTFLFEQEDGVQYTVTTQYVKVE